MLAIVVPAYRSQFFRLALNSITAQSDRNFKCYIFDDNAPEEIKSISDDFHGFSYTRFDENMGGYDLIQHWHRCLEYVKEEWVWLFSDDDVMDSNCVEEFYKALSLYPKAAAFRFARKLIDANGQEIQEIRPIKDETGLEFLKSRFTGSGSCLQDHILNWKKLKEINGGFVNFPLAWCSDDATWCLLGEIHKIIAIPSAHVQIRISGINISSMKNTEALRKKLHAFMLFYLWCTDKFKLPLSYKWMFIKRLVSSYDITSFSHFFQLPIFRSPVLFLSALLMPIRKLLFSLFYKRTQ